MSRVQTFTFLHASHSEYLRERAKWVKLGKCVFESTHVQLFWCYIIYFYSLKRLLFYFTSPALLVLNSFCLNRTNPFEHTLWKHLKTETLYWDSLVDLTSKLFVKRPVLFAKTRGEQFCYVNLCFSKSLSCLIKEVC